MSTDVRCPVCREVVDSDEIRAHLKAHSIEQMFMTTWRLDRRYALLTAALGSALLLLLVVVWLVAHA